MLFTIKDKKLIPVKEAKISAEKDIQKLTEENLEEIFGYTFVTSEMRVDNFRFDTLAWEPENRAFIIIEYKRDRNFSVVDQGFSYLSTLLNKKAEFIVEYNEHMKDSLKRDDVDWSQTRIVFIAPSFTAYQINSINFRNMAFDLYEVKMYSNGTIAYNQIKPSGSIESIDTVMRGIEVEEVSKEINPSTIEDHFKPGRELAKEIFEVLNEKILELDPNIRVDPKRHYIGYKLNQWNVITVHVYKEGLQLHFLRTSPEELTDPEQRVKLIENSIKYYSQNMSYIRLKSIEDIDYTLMLIKQVYKRFMEIKGP